MKTETIILVLKSFFRLFSYIFGMAYMKVKCPVARTILADIKRIKIEKIIFICLEVFHRLRQFGVLNCNDEFGFPNSIQKGVDVFKLTADS